MDSKKILKTDNEQETHDEKFDGRSDELMKRLWECKELCYDFNHLRPTQFKEQDHLIRKILGKTGENIMVVAPFWCDMGVNIEVGENFFMNQNSVLLDCGKITFGDNALTALSILPSTPSTLRAETAAKKAPNPFISAIMSGLAAVSLSCPVSPSVIILSLRAAAL